MTQLRRVRALHLAPCCTLHTYSIGRAASQRNNIATIHHISAVNKTSGSFCHPRFLVALALSLDSSIFSCYLFPSLQPLSREGSSHRVAIPLQSFFLSGSHSIHVFAASAYLFDFFFPPVPSLVVPSTFFARLIFSLLGHPLPLPPLPSYTRIFFLSTFPPRSTSIRFPACAVPLLSLSLFFSPSPLFVILLLSLSLVSRVYAASEKKRPPSRALVD